MRAQTGKKTLCRPLENCLRRLLLQLTLIPHCTGDVSELVAAAKDLQQGLGDFLRRNGQRVSKEVVEHNCFFRVYVHDLMVVIQPPNWLTSTCL